MGMEINKLIPNTQTFNKAYILFEEERAAKQWLENLNSMRIQHTKFIWVINHKRYYGFKMFRIKRQFFELVTKLTEVIEC